MGVAGPVRPDADSRAGRYLTVSYLTVSCRALSPLAAPYPSLSATTW
jgi:hypothetical protein